MIRIKDRIGLFKEHRTLRFSLLAMLLFGFSGAVLEPYKPVIALKQFGLSDNAYAGLTFAASLIYVVAAVYGGYLSDRFRTYYTPLILAAVLGVAGHAAVWVHPTPLTFVLAILFPVALFGLVNTLLFGNLRAQTPGFSAEEITVSSAMMRMMLSVAWILVPGIVGLVLVKTETMNIVFLLATVFSAACLLTVLIGLKPAKTAFLNKPSPSAPPAGLPVFALTGVLNRTLGLKILGVALISQVLTVNVTILPLIVTGRANGDAGDIGILVGMVALLEVFFIFFWLSVVRTMRLTTALGIATFLYFLYLSALAVATAPWHVYAASLIGGFAAAAVISLPVPYVLNLIKNRPGLSASLIAVNVFLGAALGAGVFALGTSLGGYETALILGGLTGMSGAGLLMYCEKPTP